MAESTVASKEEQRVLDSLRKMKEVDIHQQVIIPLLRDMGMSHVRHVHGNFERGKDILYLSKDSFNDDRLEVCQVKNEAFTGQAGDKNSTTAAFQQLHQSRTTEVLNPATSRMELPQGVVLWTTYPLPDRTVAGAGAFLDHIHQTQCKIIPPEKFVRLLKQHSAELFAELAFPGQGFTRTMRIYVSAHREASAFDLARQRDLDDFFINLGMAHSGEWLPKIAKGELKLRSPESVKLPTPVYQLLTCFHAELGPPFAQVQLFQQEIDQIYDTTTPSPRFMRDEREDQDEAEESGLTDGPSPNQAREVRLRRLAFRELVKELACHCARCRVTINNELDVAARNKQTSGLIAVLSRCEYLIGDLIRIFGDEVAVPSAKPTAHPPYLFHLPEVRPVALLDLPSSVCIVADAGAGKTCVARKLAREALEREVRCFYFPCATIRNSDMTLPNAMREFALSLTSDKAGAINAIRDAELIILDGCDEAATFGDQLWGEIESLAFRKPVRVSVEGSAGHSPSVPLDLQPCVAYEARRKQLVIRRLIGWVDYHRLLAANENTPFAPAIEEAYRQMQAQNPRVIVTTKEPPDPIFFSKFIGVRLMPFSDNQLSAFFEKWFSGSEKAALEVIGFVGKSKRLKEICKTPLTATMIASIYENDLELPKSKTEVYRERFNMLLTKWDKMRRVVRRNCVSASDKILFLQRLALKLHLEHRRQFTLSDAVAVWQEGFARSNPGTSVEEFLWELRVCNSLLVTEGQNIYSLGHLSYQEYLAAGGMMMSQQVRRFAPLFFDPWWREVLVFYAGIAGDVGPILGNMQSRSGVIDTSGLLDEMMKEARFTSPVVQDFVADFHDDDAGTHLGPAGEDLGQALHSDTDLDDIPDRDAFPE